MTCSSPRAILPAGRFNIDFTLNTVAALLLLAGYSINDTVVVFDRIRENRRKYKRMTLTDMINLSTNQIATRTTLVSAATALSVMPLSVRRPGAAEFQRRDPVRHRGRHLLLHLCRGGAAALSARGGRRASSECRLAGAAMPTTSSSISSLDHGALTPAGRCDTDRMRRARQAQRPAPGREASRVKAGTSRACRNRLDIARSRRRGSRRRCGSAPG